MRSARGSWCLLRLGHRMLLFAWLRGACSAPGRPPKAPVLTRGHMHVTSRGSKFPRGVEITVPICIVPARAGTAAAGLRRADRGDDRKRKRPRPRRVPGRRHGRLPVQARAQEPHLAEAIMQVWPLVGFVAPFRVQVLRGSGTDSCPSPCSRSAWPRPSCRCGPFYGCLWPLLGLRCSGVQARIPVQARAQEPPGRGHHAGGAPFRVCGPF